MALQLRLRPNDRVMIDAFDDKGMPVVITLGVTPDNRTHARLAIETSRRCLIRREPGVVATKGGTP